MTSSLTPHEKLALIILRDSGVSASIVARAFGISTGSVAAYMANANRGHLNYSSVPAKKK